MWDTHQGLFQAIVAVFLYRTLTGYWNERREDRSTPIVEASMTWRPTTLIDLNRRANAR